MTIINVPQSDVLIYDDLPPEAAAMLLALYSRDPRSARIHREKIAEVGAEKFMGQYYVGYGHKSIGDCGTTTICAEFVSMLAAKAIQDNELYNGQEASTRYLDMQSMPVLNPLGTTEGAEIQEVWMNFYSRVLEELIPYLKTQYPMLPEDKPGVYEKAIKAKAFDIARSFLPAGCTTFVGWHTNLRQAWDHVKEMSFHPLPEVRELSAKILNDLKEKYPNSFGFKSYPEQDDYMATCSEYYYSNLKLGDDFHYITDELAVSRMRNNHAAMKLLATRPEKTELPNWFKRFGTIQFRFHLDFGSFRDIQRHRSCTQLMPLLTTSIGFNEWYLNSLPIHLRIEAEKIIKMQISCITKIENPEIRQYYTAMGFNVACELTASLPSAIYIAELRSGQTVHPTLRPIAQQMGNALKSVFPEMTLHIDYSPDEWSTKRGTHDIVKKSE